MKPVEARYKILTKISEGGMEELKFIEEIGRTCYHSEDKITPDGESAKKFVASLIRRGHESVLEHSLLTVRFWVDRGISHEGVRHRHCAFTQESTRYCNYSDTKKFPDGISFVRPVNFEPGSDRYNIWIEGCKDSEFWYLEAIKHGAKPEEARSLLSDSKETVLTWSANYREWRHILKLRADIVAHPDMRRVMVPLIVELQEKIPIIFDDVL